MRSGIYKIAQRLIHITTQYPATHELCRDYAAEGEPDVRVSVTPEDIRTEAKISAAQNAREGKTQRILPEDYLETLAVYRKIAEEMLTFDTLLIHGSAICLDGEGYLFIAKSGTGKSTHTRLWREAFGGRAFMVNDDKPLLKISHDGVYVCGTPWDGKHHLSTNTMVPLKVICILERGAETEIHPISAAQALPRLLEQCYRPEGTEGFLKTLTLLDTLSKTASFYRLHCNMAPEAAKVAYQGMVSHADFSGEVQ